MLRIIYLIFFITCLNLSTFAQPGIITGTVKDRETQKPIFSAIISVVELSIQTVTDYNGEFTFDSIPLGTYQIKITAASYEPIVKTDIVVLSAKPTHVSVELQLKSYITDTIDVVGKMFQKSIDQSTSTFNLDFEEIRRAPGAVEDISRMVQILPGVSQGNDQRNDLIVRGGSPSENMTLIDGIEIPNINHYPSQASSSGAVSMINVKFINEVNFSTGGFSARYGDKLSSILDIRFREGNKENFFSDINLSTAGFGGVFEGPLIKKKGTFLFSIRKSYLNLIKSAIRIAAVPDYWDFSLKTTYEFNQNNILSFIGIGALDKIRFEGDEAKISDENPYGKVTGHQEEFTAGFNLKTLFKKGYLQTVFSNSSSFYYYDNYDITTDSLIFDYNSHESEFTLRSEINYQLNPSNNFVIGASGKYILFKNKMYLSADTSYFGDPYPPYYIDIKNNFWKASAFIQYTLKLLKDRLLINAGMRFDYFSGIEDNRVFTPRLAVSFRLTAITTINASTGIFCQAPEYLWVTSDAGNRKLKYVRAYHYIAGIEHLFTEDLKFSVEAYYKKYENYPVSVLTPTFVLISGGTENGPNFVGEATSKGYGYSRGIDFSIQKKLSKIGLYGMINYSLSESRVTALKGGEKPGSFDYRHNLTVIAGYQITDEWLIGLKFRYTTGRPYTPFDIQASIISRRGVYQADKFNEARYKDYNRLDIRVDKKWNFKKVSIISYIELQNVFNVTNVYEKFWNKYKNEEGTIYQWAFMPVGGFSVQF